MNRALAARTAALARELAAVDEAVAWCVAVRVPRSNLGHLIGDLKLARELLGEPQSHERVARIIARVDEAARSILPRADIAFADAPACAPRPVGENMVLENDFVRAQIGPNGSMISLAGAAGINVLSAANLVHAPRGVFGSGLRVEAPMLVDDAVVIRGRGERFAYELGVSVRVGEPWIRVACALDWRAPKGRFALEHRGAIGFDAVRFGEPEKRRFAHVAGREHGLALFSTDVFDWEATSERDGSVTVRLNVADGADDHGEHHVAFALAPTWEASVGALETAFGAYADLPRVRLFTCDDLGVVIEAVKPADDGDGTIVRVRECDGVERNVALRCGGRIGTVLNVDANERTVAGDVRVDGEIFAFVMPTLSTRLFRVRP